MRAPEVDAWLETRAHPLDDVMRLVRDVILDADPRVTECIKWQTPTFVYKGNIASFNPSKHLVSVMFHRGAEIPGTHPRLEGDGQLVRTMRFRSVAEVRKGRRDLTNVIKAWCEAKG